jgi:hypothetical protein
MDFKHNPEQYLGKFNPRSIQLGTISLFYAKRYSGKSVLMKRLIEANRSRFDGIMIISNTAFNGFYNSLLNEGKKDVVIHPRYESILLERLLQKQKTDKAFKNVLLVLDDVIGEENMRNDKGLNQIATEGRHYNITLFFATQNATSISPVLRNNCDYAFLFKQFNEDAVETLAKSYSILPLEKRQFKQMLQGRATDDYGVIVVNMRTQNTDDIKARYALYRAKV